MAYMQRVRITKDSDLDDDTTWRYKLPSIGKYTAFLLRVNCDRYQTRDAGDEVHPLESCISKIEMLAGGARALFSLTGQQIDALNYWDFKRPNARRYRQEGGTDNHNLLFLTGGRDLYDVRYGWDMAKLGETYLEYTYDLSEDVAEYFKGSDHDVALYGYRWMGPGEPNFIGYFRSRQLAAWATTGGSALKTIAIPVGNPVRRIGVQSKTSGTSLGGAFTELEVRCNEGEYSPVVVKSMMTWVQAEIAEYGLHNQLGGIEYVKADTQMDLPNWWSYHGTLTALAYAIEAQHPLVTRMLQLPGRFMLTTSATGELIFTARGFGFQKCLRIGFDHDYDGYDLLRTAGLGSLDLLVTENGASKNAAVFVQDIVSY